MIKISSILRNTHVVSRDQDKFVFYVNNNIDWDQFNQLYDSDWIEKVTKSADAIARKFGLALTRVTNYRLKVAREKGQKREEIVEKWRRKAMAAKRQRARGGISLSSKEERNYEINTGDETDPDQVNDEYPLPN